MTQVLCWFDRWRRAAFPIKGINARVSTLVVLLALTAGLAVRLSFFISRYAVNLLFSDEWDFYTPLFKNLGWWQTFTWQHGPHREGIGLVLTRLLDGLTGWNTRADALAAGALVILATGLALALKYRLFGTLTLADVIIPLIGLTLFQYETFLGAVNLSYGACPLVLIVLYSLGLLIRNPYARYATVLGLNFLLIFTGFGVFMGLVTIGVLALDGYQQWRSKSKTLWQVSLALGLALASMAAFFVDYTFNPAIGCFGFSPAYLMQYPLFMGLMLAAFWGWHMLILGALAIVAGAILLLVVVALGVFHGRRLVTTGVYASPVSLVAAAWLGYGVLFCLNTAIGRVCSGLPAAQVSRYMTPLIPAFWGVYFSLLAAPRLPWRRVLLTGYFTMALVGSLPLGIVDGLAQTFYSNKTHWKECYRQFEDAEKCEALANFKVYPAASQLAPKLSYLKQHHLNLFLSLEK